MSNPLELSHACRQSLQRTQQALAEPGPLASSRTLASLLAAAGHLADLAHASGAAPGACVTPLGPWCGNHQGEALQFLNTAALLPAAATGQAAGAGAPAAAAAAGSASAEGPLPPTRLHMSPLEASRFDAALEKSTRAFAASAAALMKR
jgi:hypothetical protein